MKILNLLFALYFAVLTFAQAQVPPQAFNYSAVARNAAGQPIATTTIGIQITILKTSPTGASQYSENHFVNTDAFGLFNLVVGAGAVQSGSMATIDWSNDNYYLKVGMDAAGGTNFLIMGSTQLLSVPYALYAKSAGTINGGGNGFNHYIGEIFGGGVIFRLWKDDNGIEHGLIVDLVDLSTTQVWSNVDNTSIGTTALSDNDGISNSNAIISQQGHANSAAALCLNSNNGGQNDWYLPAFRELWFLAENILTVNNSLASITGASTLPLLSLPVFYWSSTEFSHTAAWYCRLTGGKMYEADVDYYEINKNTPARVRAIREF